jgi:hypothetical protein
MGFPDIEERLQRLLDEKARESVFPDRKPFKMPAIIRTPNFPVIESPKGRGVYVEELCPPDECWYKVVLSNGKIGIVHFPIDLCDDALLENLWRRLDAKDPERHLKAI